MLRDTVQGVLRDLSALSERVLAVLRGEPQVACVLLLAQLATEGPLFDQDTSRGSVVASQRSTGKYGLSSMGVGTGSSSSGDADGGARAEEPPSVAALFAFLNAYKDTVSQGLTAAGAQAALAPLRVTLPNLLLRSVDSQCKQEIIANKQAMSAGGSGSGGNGGQQELSISPRSHARLSKLVVGLHKALSLILDAHRQRHQPVAAAAGGSGGAGGFWADGEASSWSLAEALSAEFDRVRRFLALLTMPQEELSMYLRVRDNRLDYSKEQLHTLWLRISPLHWSSLQAENELYEKVWKQWNS